MAVVFVGSVEIQHSSGGGLQPYGSKKAYQIRGKDEVIMSQAFYKTTHPTVVAREETVLLYLNKEIYKKIQMGLKKEIFEKSRAEVSDMMKSDFFV